MIKTIWKYLLHLSLTDSLFLNLQLSSIAFISLHYLSTISSVSLVSIHTTSLFFSFLDILFGKSSMVIFIWCEASRRLIVELILLLHRQHWPLLRLDKTHDGLFWNSYEEIQVNLWKAFTDSIITYNTLTNKLKAKLKENGKTMRRR